MLCSLQHEDLEHSLRARNFLAAAFDNAFLEWPGLGRGLFLFALCGFLDGAVCCAFAAVYLSDVLVMRPLELDGYGTYVAALLGDPDLLLDVVVAFA